MRDDRARFAVAPETKERLVEQFLTAIQTQNQEAILALVAEDATWTSDSGGRVSAARNVIHGAGHIARFVLGGEQLVFTTSIVTDGERLVAFYRVLNPEKLRHVSSGKDNPDLRPGTAC